MIFKKYKLLILGAFIILLLVIIFNNVKKVNSQTIEPVLEIKEDEVEPEFFYVDIKGMINNPGVYKINSDKRVIDVINEAGGLKENADTSLINLSKKVMDEMVIIIYSKDEIENTSKKQEIVKIVEKECVCPEIKNDSCINTNKNADSFISDSGYISLNNSTLEELTSIPGLGEAKAKSIIEYRSKNSYFKSIDELMNVSGIGEKLFEKIKVYFSL